MNATILFAYLFVAGLIGGLYINDKAERCGEPVTIKNSDITAWLAWPVLAGARYSAKDGAIATPDVCGQRSPAAKESAQ